MGKTSESVRIRPLMGRIYLDQDLQSQKSVDPNLNASAVASGSYTTNYQVDGDILLNETFLTYTPSKNLTNSFTFVNGDTTAVFRDSENRELKLEVLDNTTLQNFLINGIAYEGLSFTSNNLDISYIVNDNQITVNIDTQNISFSDLDGVDISTAIEGDVLRYTSGIWQASKFDYNDLLNKPEILEGEAVKSYRFNPSSNGQTLFNLPLDIDIIITITINGLETTNYSFTKPTLVYNSSAEGFPLETTDEIIIVYY